MGSEGSYTARPIRGTSTVFVVGVREEEKQ
jgi:hypothetical protein